MPADCGCTARFRKNQPIDPSRLSYEIYTSDNGGGDRRLLVPSAKEGHIVRLNAGIYHVVSKYGEVNAIVRADIKVEPGSSPMRRSTIAPPT